MQLARLAPTEDVRAAFHVVLDDAERRTGVRVIAFMAMSNRYHAVVEDVQGRFGEWASAVNGVLARFVNSEQGQDSHVWDAKERSDQKVAGLSKIAEQVAYALVNPVRAGVVRSPSAWPGAMTALEDIGSGSGRVYGRPKGFFRAKGPVAKEGVLRSHTPSGYTREEFCEAVEEAYRRKLAEAHAEMKASGRRYLGAEQAKGQAPLRAPTRRAPRDAGSTAATLRRVVAATPELSERMLAEERAFRELYEGCLAQLRAGTRDVVFPAGTYKLHHVYGLSREASAAQAEAAQAAS